jgi:DNA-binding response OmpR family regulator
MPRPGRQTDISAARQALESRLSPVLIVEDEAPLRHMVEAALRVIGLQTITAATVAEAERVRARHRLASLALVVTNVHLTADPDTWEGYELWERWRAARPDLPFLLLSGDPATRELWGVRTGAVRLLLKPFDVGEFHQVVRELLGV